ncbi:MAG TPA: 4Fe-4S dicluster domain-containing protein [Firmicutes bacterium]|jgi:coenzyme F420-reducing hydrogenase beta subunit|nr:4Fe-4S dicluster domain-containing protein [Bacillota bacterium]
MEKTVNKTVNAGKCTGCQLCYNVCNNSAIVIVLSKEGFYVPRIDSRKCCNCGECLKFCPVENNMLDGINNINVYAAKSNNEKIRALSSSGGLFFELAKFTLEQKGIVFGAGFNDNNKLVHFAVNAEDDLIKLCGSKYLQSNINLSYKKVRDCLNERKKIMFAGTPCQVTALRNYVGQNENLLTIDLVCHGVPSIRIFEKYIHYTFGDEKPKNIYFRDKQYDGWNNYYVKLEGPQNCYKESHKRDPFFMGYLKNLYLNRICYDCPFCKTSRNSDLTLGDFWGIDQNIDDDKGISLVLINSGKGEKVFRAIMLEGRISASLSDIESAIKQNPRVISGHMKIPQVRDKIFKEIDNFSFKEIDSIFIKSPRKEVLLYAKKCIRSKPIIIFGGGSGGQKILEKLTELGAKEIKCFIDNDISKEGSKFLGFAVYGSWKIQEKNNDVFIIVASTYYDEISEQLVDMGFEENRDYIDGVKYLL